jgi:quercetin dioxygenase-like cupin family protein
MKLSIACAAAATLAALVSLAPGPFAQNYPPPFPRDGVVKVAENDRVIVWDLHWKKGVPTPMHAHTLDVVAVFLEGVTTKTVAVDGTTRIGNPMRKGDALFQPRGVIHTEEATTDGGRVIGVELKDAPPLPPLANRPNLPPGFPRDGAARLIDNARVTVWDFTWIPGRPVPMHFHDKDTVVVFIDPGKIRSTDAEGRTTVADRKFGDVSLNARNRAHTEETIEGSPRAIVVELK